MEIIDMQTLTGSKYDRWFWFDFWCFNATFSNILVISWRPVLVVEEAGVPGENHRPWTLNWYTLSLAVASREKKKQWLLFMANSAILQLYHGENKLIFNEMMIMSALY
jgi:hypothetical protein